MNVSTTMKTIAKKYDSANATPNTKSIHLVGPMKCCRSDTNCGLRSTLPVDDSRNEDLPRWSMAPTKGDSDPSARALVVQHPHRQSSARPRSFGQGIPIR